jgi:hypothetical protein
MLNTLYRLGITLSRNYQGDLNIENVLLPNDQSCSLHLTYIPADATTHDVFQAISEGGIYNYSPSGPQGFYSTSAAHLAFKTRTAAELFYFRAKFSERGVRVLGQRIAVIWNRNKSAPLEDSQMDQSRVLRIWGPKDLVSSSEIEELFHRNLKFELVDQKEWLQCDGQIRVVELFFQSILGQSRQAKKCFLKNIKSGNLDASLSIAYAPDPCEPDYHHRQSLYEWHR